MIEDICADVMIISETWHCLNTDISLRRLAPSGYAIIDAPRPVVHHNTNVSIAHGGLAVVHRSQFLSRRIIYPLQPTIFELLICSLKISLTDIIFVVIYRPGSQPVTTAFLDEFSTLLETICLYNSATIIAGDFNLHVVTDEPYVAHFLELLNAFSVEQHVV